MSKLFDLSTKEDRDFLRGRWIMNKDTGEEYQITAFVYRNNKRYVNISKGLFTFQILSRNYTFLDGEIIGK